ncbi:MAG: MATE family efflux transporter [Oscillospiraceae bacterium]|nr:MATE family efflux transporter [Oscillospiraceae bacterium]
MSELIRRFFSCQAMMKKHELHGELPPDRQVYQNTLRIAWPSIVEAVLVSLISAIDTMMVGTIGPEAISAVGITGQPRMILVAVIFSLNAGVTAVVARRRGQGDTEGARRCLKQCLLLNAAASLLICTLGMVFAKPLMAFAGAQPEILGDATSYFQILVFGTFFSNIGLTINAAQRGVGNTRISMTTNIAANVVNVIFNFLLINGIWFFPKLGVIGAGIATVLGNIVALALAFRSVWKRTEYLDLSGDHSWLPDKATMSSVFSVSGSALVEQVFIRIGFFTYAKTVASLGTIPFAAHQICMNLISFSFAVGDGFSIASSSLVGQSLGAKRPDMAQLYVYVTQRIAAFFAAALFILFFAARVPLLMLYTTDAEVIDIGKDLMIILAASVPFQILQVIITGCLRGAGDSKYVARTSFISIAAIRPILSWVLCYPVGLGVIGAWLGLFADQALRMALNYARFSTGKWTKIKL